MNNYKYWFYLEPFTFLFHEKEKFVIYNTLNSVYIDCSIYDEQVHRVLNNLFNSEANYCVGLNQEQFVSQSLQTFIDKIRESFSGDIIENNLGVAPYIFKPILRIFHHPESAKTKEYNLLGLNSLLYLHEVIFYLGNQAEDLCIEHENCYKQFLHPIKTANQILTIEKYNEILNQLSVCQLDKISIIPGIINDNALLSSLLQLINEHNFKAELILPYKIYDLDDVDSVIGHKISARILIHLPTNKDELESQMNLFLGYNITWVFIVSEDRDIDYIQSFNVNEGVNVEYLPWYNGSNDSFINKYVSSELEDIIEFPINKQKIFRRQILNENFFGKLTIFPTGEVYSNANFPSIGDVTNLKLTEIVYNEVSKFSMPWFMTRNNCSCESCINKYLCPSISNYEVVMNEYNFCYLNKTKQ